MYKISNHNDFLSALHSKSKIKVTFYSKEDFGFLERVCAPMDYAKGARIKDRIPRYWVWDYESDKTQHPLPLRDTQIKSLEILQDKFNPSDFIKWTPNWSIPRDWGQYS